MRQESDPMWDPNDEPFEANPDDDLLEGAVELYSEKRILVGRRKRSGEKHPRPQIHWSVKAKVANRDMWRCFYCEVDMSDGSGQFDHKISVSKGGSSTARNLAYCCVRCNMRKMTMNAAEFLEFLAEERIAKADRAASRRAK